MKNTKSFLTILFVAAAFLVSVYILVLLVEGLIPQAWRVIATNSVLTVISIYLVIFLLILMFRYIVLVFFSYFEHVEHERESVLGYGSRLDEGGDPDRFLPKISIVVPAYNEEVVIQPALSALLELNYPDYEVIVVDDGSTDDTYLRARELAGDHQGAVPVKVITKPNGGKADALNTGMAHASGEFILNMDGDTKLNKDALREAIRHFRDPKVGAVAGNVKVLNRDNMLTRIQALEYIEGLGMVRKAQSFASICNIIPGPLGLFRKEAMLEVKGYDEDTFAEDCDVTLKLLVRGWQVKYEPEAIAWVESPSRYLDLIQQRYRWTRGILQAIKKHVWSLKNPFKSGINFWVLAYMLFESIIWPVSNVLGHLFFIYMGFQFGLITLLAFWWLQLTIFDLIAATYCVIIEKEDYTLVFYAVFFRVFYVLGIDIMKVFAFIEELMGRSMVWGKLEREGKL